MSDSIILYDLPSRDPCKCWSLNPWKTRLYLNYKSLPYTTEWTEYPDLAPKFSSLGVAKNEDERVMDYTSPCVKLPSGDLIQNSWAIAQHLEKQHPSPSLRLESPYLKQVTETLPKVQEALHAIYVVRVPRMLLNERSEKYFRETREKKIGMTLEEYHKSDKGGAAAFAAAAEPLGVIVRLLQENSGPYFEGDTVSYADFVFVGFLRFMDRIEVLGDVLDACEKGRSGGKEAAEEVYKECAKWLERDDY